MKTSGSKGLNRDTIKYIAMITMLLNHIAHVFPMPNVYIQKLLLDIGYFTAPTMCYFLVEGYGYTRSKLHYGLRLFFFAVLSQAPFYLALGIRQLNMLFTLFFCFLILVAKEHIKNRVFLFLVYLFLIFATGYSDWSYMAAVFTLMFAYSVDSTGKKAASYCAAVALWAWNLYEVYKIYPPVQTAVWVVGSCMGVAASGIVVLCFYNGQRTRMGRTFSKWFFYLFYPLHLLALWGLKRYIII